MGTLMGMHTSTVLHDAAAAAAASSVVETRLTPVF